MKFLIFNIVIIDFSLLAHFLAVGFSVQVPFIIWNDPKKQKLSLKLVES